VASDPLAALAAAEQLPARLQKAVKAVIDREWARLDAAGYLAFVEANPEYLEELTGRGHYEPEPILERSAGIRLLLASDPLSVVSLADNLSSRLGITLKVLALSAYAELDPSAAIALVERMPRGQKRDEALAGIAEGYALADPEGALAWASSLSPAPPAVLANVLQGIARNDIHRAVQLGLQIEMSSASVGNVPQFPPINTVILNAAEDSVQAALVADGLLATDAARRDDLLERLLQGWAEHDPESLIGWVRTNAARVDGEILSGAAYALASRDPALAARYTDQMPFVLRASWIERVAQGYATADPAGALDWISQYRGQEGYEVGMRLVVVNYAVDDPAMAARALQTADEEIQLGAARTVADRWARQDGAAAAEWALGLTNASVRAAALPEAVGAWMSQSSQAAEDWTLRLPRSQDRDQALYVLLQGRTRTDQPRESYSTNPTRVLIAQISDSALRREVEAWFEGESGP